MFSFSNEMCLCRLEIFRALFFDGNLFAQFHLSRFFGTFFFYEFVIHSKCTFTHRIRCISMPFGFCEVKITRRCVLMRERESEKKLFSRLCVFLYLPLNYSNAMSIEFEIEQNGISICTCHFIWETWITCATEKNDEEFSLISIICLDLFSPLFRQFFSFTFQIDWLNIQSHLPALYFNELFSLSNSIYVIQSELLFSHYTLKLIDYIESQREKNKCQRNQEWWTKTTR